MKITIPDQLKNDVPKNQWGKVLSSTPIVMTVVATLLAGLASSEMTRAQYDRSLGAQQQSQAGDQWSFFQAKRLRSALQENTLELLQGTTELHPLDDAALRQAAQQLPAMASLRTNLLARLDASAGLTRLTGPLPDLAAETAPDAGLKTALAAVENSQPESAIAPLLAPLPVEVLNAALLAAQGRAQSFDAAIKPANELSDLFLQLAAQLPFNAANTGLRRDITVLRLRYLIRRYDAEARLNQRIANLVELQVRKSNLTAERHHRRSQRFFFGMLAGQAAVIVSTFALATSRRSLLWSLAAAAGLVAILFAIYVYLFV